MSINSGLVFLQLYKKPNYKFKKHLIVAWLVGPPLYFLFNYYVIWRFMGNHPNEDAFEHYKHSQELYRNVWAGMSALIIYLATRKNDQED